MNHFGVGVICNQITFISKYLSTIIIISNHRPNSEVLYCYSVMNGKNKLLVVFFHVLYAIG